MAFQFKIQLKNISKPPVWRQLIVPQNFTFEQFHQVIQEAFGWSNSHLYQFSPGGYGSNPIIAPPSGGEWEEPDKNALKTKLKDIFHTEKQKYTYIYDFGDDWIHSIVLEKIVTGKVQNAFCLDGKGTCPPEDCGGPFGYERLLEVLNDPKHEDYADMREWLGLEDDDQWSTNDFDLDFTNELLSEI